MEAAGLKLPIGALCFVARDNGGEQQYIESEVVGFNGKTLYLMPLEHVEGLLPGALIYTEKNIPPVKNCRWVKNCSAGCLTREPGLLMACRFRYVKSTVNCLPLLSTRSCAIR